MLKSRNIECSGVSEDITSADKAVASESVCIDFTVPEAFRANYKFIAENFKAAVIGTTGWYDIADEVFAYFEKCGTPLIWASNFSVGVNVFSAAVDLVSKLLAKSGGYAPYIVEKHHCHKIDAPSGTAKTLARDIDLNMGVKTDVASVRVGELAGIHTVGFRVAATGLLSSTRLSRVRDLRKGPCWRLVWLMICRRMPAGRVMYMSSVNCLSEEV